MTLPLIISRPEGLYCPEGEFFIDPWRPVDRAVITHAHSDNARRGNGPYLAHRDSAELLRIRLGGDISLQTVDYGEAIEHKGVRISLHPAGHVLGSAQVRLERRGRVWVASGDYKLADDGTCRSSCSRPRSGFWAIGGRRTCSMSAWPSWSGCRSGISPRRRITVAGRTAVNYRPNTADGMGRCRNEQRKVGEWAKKECSK